MPNQATSVSLPRDDDSSPIPVLMPDITGSIVVAATEGASANAALPANSEIVRVAATGQVWVSFGVTGVDAGSGQTDSFLVPGGAEYFFVNGQSITHVAARSVTGAGNVSVSVTKME